MWKTLFGSFFLALLIGCSILLAATSSPNQQHTPLNSSSQPSWNSHSPLCGLQPHCRSEAAAAVVLRALEEDPRNLYCLFDMANCYLDLGHQTAALASYREAVSQLMQIPDEELKERFESIWELKHLIDRSQELTRSLQRIQKQAKKQAATRVLQTLEQTNNSLVEVSIRTVAQARQEDPERQQRSEEQIQILFSTVQAMQQQLAAVRQNNQCLRDEVALLRSQQAEHLARSHQNEQQHRQLSEATALVRGKVLAEEEAFTKIGKMDPVLAEYYTQLYALLLTHFRSYSLASGGFFPLEPRQFSVSDKLIAYATGLLTFLRRLPVLGEALAAPLELLEALRKDRTARYNLVVSTKIRQSRFRSDTVMAQTLAFAFSTLTDEALLNSLLSQRLWLPQRDLVGVVRGWLWGEGGESRAKPAEVAATHLVGIWARLFEMTSWQWQQVASGDKAMSAFLKSAIRSQLQGED